MMAQKNNPTNFAYGLNIIASRSVAQNSEKLSLSSFSKAEALNERSAALKNSVTSENSAS